MMIAGSAFSTSCSVKSRPRTIGIPIAWKYPGVTVVFRGERMDSPGFIR